MEPERRAFCALISVSRAFLFLFVIGQSPPLRRRMRRRACILVHVFYKKPTSDVHAQRSAAHHEVTEAVRREAQAADAGKATIEGAPELRV